LGILRVGAGVSSFWLVRWVMSIKIILIMVLDSNEIQEVNGYFQVDGQTVGDEIYQAKIDFNRFNVRDSYILFNDHVPQYWRDESFFFVIDNKYKLYLNHPSQYWSGTYSETKFTIKKLVIDTKTDKYVRTGAIKKLVYFPRELRILGFKLNANEYTYFEGEKRKGKTYFDCTYQNSISDEEFDKILMVLSVLSCSSFFISEKSDGEKVEIHNFKSTECKVPYSGSGNMYFPVQVHTLEKLIDEVRWKDLNQFNLAYKSFCRTENLVFQLYNGCAILDWLIELFSRNLNDIKKARIGKSAILYRILNFLELNDAVKKYLESIFPEIPFNGFTFEKKFEFYELRDKYIHRGGLLLTDDDIRKFQRCIVSLNEILRILIPFLHLIKEWQFTDKPFYQTLGSEEIVNERQRLIKWEL